MGGEGREGSEMERDAGKSGKLNAARLASELRARMRGEVCFDEGSRALYATDASNYRQAPIGVVFPRSEEDVIAAIADLGRFTVDRLMSIINRPGSRVEVKICVRPAQAVVQEARA